MNLLTPEDL